MEYVRERVADGSNLQCKLQTTGVREAAAKPGDAEKRDSGVNFLLRNKILLSYRTVVSLLISYLKFY